MNNPLFLYEIEIEVNPWMMRSEPSSFGTNLPINLSLKGLVKVSFYVKTISKGGGLLCSFPVCFQQSMGGSTWEEDQKALEKERL